MKIAVFILCIAGTVNGQSTDTILHGKDVHAHSGLFINQASVSEQNTETGKNAWQYLTPSKKRFLTRYAKTCYKDHKGEIWTTWFQERHGNEKDLGQNPLWWYNINRDFGGEYQPVAEDAEPISKEELLGAMLNNNFKPVLFYRDKIKISEPVYELVQVRYRSIDGQIFWRYEKREVEKAKYETYWKTRSLKISLERIKKDMNKK